jgi:hypothetical protein
MTDHRPAHRRGAGRGRGRGQRPPSVRSIAPTRGRCTPGARAGGHGGGCRGRHTGDVPRGVAQDRRAAAGERILLPWLVTICRFQAANRVRRQKRDREHPGRSRRDPSCDGRCRARGDRRRPRRSDRGSCRTLGPGSGDLPPVRSRGLRLSRSRRPTRRQSRCGRNRLSRIRSSLRTTITSEGS